MDDTIKVNVSELNSPTPNVDALNFLDKTTISEIFKAYGLSQIGLDENQQKLYLEGLAKTKRTFPYLCEVLISDRSPSIIIKLADGVGMFIPSKHRWGKKAYKFYLSNIRYYESGFDRSNQKFPQIHELCFIR